MNNAVKHYASLFRLPSQRRIVALQALLCSLGGMLSTFMIFPTAQGAISGLIFGSSLLAVVLAGDVITSRVVLSNDPIYDMRRTAVLSLVSAGIWYLFVFIGSLAGIYAGTSWWAKISLVGFAAVLIFRLIVFASTLSVDMATIVAASILQPLLCLIPFWGVWLERGLALSMGILAFVFFAFIAAVASTGTFLSVLNRVGKETLEIPSLSLLRAFLLNWITGQNAPFEKILEKLGESRSINVSMLKFESEALRAAIVVPMVHPGPFKNIGSSVLPSLLKDALEENKHCIACVPLGLQGHELDLASQEQNQKVIQQVADHIAFEASKSKATPFVRETAGVANACCQAFGRSVFLAFTLSPHTTEDLPQELDDFVQQQSKLHGFPNCVAVNAHNSIDDEATMPVALTDLKNAATGVLDKIARSEQKPFRMGAATIIPKEFSIGDGMGAGGITVIVTEVSDEKTAYVVIDGNNIVQGLRDKILNAIRKIGIDEGEILTTDTHSVSAVVLGKRGYHPIGEAIDHDALIKHIREATLRAVAVLKEATAGYHSVTIQDIKVIGEKRLRMLSLLTDRVLRQLRRVIIPIFALTGLALMLVLFLV